MKVSATLKSQSIVTERKRNELPVYDFGLGANPLPISSHYLDEMRKYLNMKNYVPASGIDLFKATINKLYSTEVYNIKHILTGNGLKELIFIVQMAFDGIIIHITPSWLSYKEQISILNKTDKLIEIETTLDNSYKINLEHLDNTLSQISSDKAKLLIFNNPNNPTGVVHTSKEVKEIADILNKYNVIVLSDEIYSNLSYVPIVSISEYIPHLTIRGTSVSKDLACGGYRLGWITFPDNLTWLYEKCNYMASSIYSCTHVPTQYATAHLLEDNTTINQIYSHTKTVFKSIITYICEYINKSNCKHMINYAYPQAAWYLFLNFDAYADKLTKQCIHTSSDLQEFLLHKYGIVTVAGDNFNISGLNLRFSLVDINDFENNMKCENICSRMKEGIILLLNYFETL